MHETGRSREDSREVMEQNGCIKEQSRKRIGNRIHSIGCLGLCILAFVLLLGLIACGRNADEAKQQGMETGTDSEEITHIIMTYQTKDSSRTEQLDAVMEAVNAIAREEIGVEVELLQVDAVQSRDLYPLLLTQGKRIDLMVLNYEDITSYIKQNMLMPLDSLLELAGQGIVNLSGQSGDLLGGALIDGSTYGISVPEETRGKCGAVWVPMRYLEEVDFYYSENHIYSLDELDVLFARLKEKHPEKYPFGQLCGNYSFTTSVFFLNDYDALGSSNWTGVLDLRKDSGIFVNYYETDGYYNWLTYLRKWYLDGYIYPDAAVTNVEPKELLRSGIIMSIPKTGMPFVFDEENCGEPMAALRTTSVISMGGSSTDIFWTLPVTCKEPEAAMRFLNLMYTNEQVVNLLAWGIEGEHYVLREDGSVSLPEGETTDTVGYYNPLSIYGNILLKYSTYSKEMREAYERFSKQAIPRENLYYGFQFDSTSVNVEMTRVQGVLNRYLPVLESGREDLDVIYPEFLTELENVGIYAIIEEKQRQFDTWLAEQEGTDASDY